MANTDIVEAAVRTIFLGDISENRPNSEAVMQKIAGNINFLIQRQTFSESFRYNGLFSNNAGFDEGAGSIVYIAQDSQIEEYYMAIQSTGNGGQSIFNVKVYNENGDFVNDLFGNGVQAISVSGNNGNSVIVGKSDISGTNTDILINTSGHTVQTGVINFTSLFKGFYLVPFIEDNALGAYHLNFNMKLRGL